MQVVTSSRKCPLYVAVVKYHHLAASPCDCTPYLSKLVSLFASYVCLMMSYLSRIIKSSLTYLLYRAMVINFLVKGSLGRHLLQELIDF